MKKSKAFTLIELLAVIIILAAIALIIAPLVLDIIREQQKKTFKESINGILRSSRLEIVNSGLSFPATFTYSDGKLLSPTGKELKVTGKIPDGSGSVRYNSEDDIDLAIHDNSLCGIYNKTSKEVDVNGFEGECQIAEGVAFTPEECFDFDASTGTVTKYHKSNSKCSVDVVIPDTIGGVVVKKIGEGAFCENYQGQGFDYYSIEDPVSLHSVVLPSGLEEIGVAAFVGSSSYYGKFNPDLTVVDMSRAMQLKLINDNAFREASLSAIEIPESVTNIGDYAFYGNDLTSVTIPSNVVKIGSLSFMLNQLSCVTILNGVTNIGYEAFFSNDLTDVIIPESVTGIEDFAFSNNGLTSVTIKGKNSSSDFTTYSNTIWGWASGYSNDNIIWNG